MKQIIWLLASCALMLGSFDIVRRHDKSDTEYLKLGAQFPAVCKVGKRGGDGTLIGSRWVLTAAHVAKGMYERMGDSLSVYFEDISKPISVEKIFLHPDFQPMAAADVALLLLSEEIDFIEPVSLYQKKNERGKEIVIVGHGYARTGLGGDWVDDGKRRAATNMIDEVGVDKIIFDFDKPAEGTELEGTAGPGDSGGPAFIIADEKLFVAGVSSAGMPGENGPGTYGANEFYTRVSTYSDWISAIMDSPDDKNVLKQSADNRRITTRQNSPLPGLGLFLMQEGERIRIGGKADPEVPKAFRHVMFKPPAYLEAFNGKSYSSLEEFKSDYQKLKSGDKFSIRFNIQGKKQSFNASKM